VGQHIKILRIGIEEAHKNETTERRSINRRIFESDGYTYIPIVGWIDRRERTRRANDTVTDWRSDTNRSIRPIIDKTSCD
jgi:hypothetical protein